MTITLDSLKDTHHRRRKKIVGHGPGSKRGKTCGRGEKGMGSRSGYKVRLGKIGGGVPLHRKVPTRGFSNAQFARKPDVINLGQIDAIYKDGETVSLETLQAKGFLKGQSYGIKILAEGELNKKLTFQVEGISKAAKSKLEKAGMAI